MPTRVGCHGNTEREPIDMPGRPRFQFSLRAFLFAVLCAGLVAGVIGPVLVAVWREWEPQPAVPKTERPIPPPAHRFFSDDSYYESGETPLY